MLVLKTIDAVNSELGRLRQAPFTIGLVPTMGALHEGHLQIIRRAIQENQVVVVSVFVNPTQFNDKTDLDRYPKNLDADLDLLMEISDDIVVFVPEVEEMYEEGLVSAHYQFNGLDKVMEGQYRPGHFQGVATVVEKLLKIIRPDKAYFGEKDYQQLLIIKKLTRQKRLPVEIVGCSIVRESNGLALSSRNSRLSKRLRKEASFIYRMLKAATVQFGTKSANSVTEWVEDQFKGHPDLELEYFVIADNQNLNPVQRKQKGKKYRGFISVFAEGIRLIDNVALN